MLSTHNLRKAVGSAICAVWGRHSPTFAEEWTLTPEREHISWRGWLCGRCWKRLPTIPDDNHLN